MLNLNVQSIQTFKIPALLFTQWLEVQSLLTPQFQSLEIRVNARMYDVDFGRLLIHRENVWKRGVLMPAGLHGRG